MDILAATRSYEAWLGRHVEIVRSDIALKHERMAESPFVLLRGTFYRWLQHWANACGKYADAPRVVAIGDLHIENFGTWRDTEGRVVWGVNDVDEAARLPYTQDLIRLATSARLAIHSSRLHLSDRDACDAILDGYQTSLARGGRAFVLAERGQWLRAHALSASRDPKQFWAKLFAAPVASRTTPRRILVNALPRGVQNVRIVRRIAGVGSLGRPRFVALGEWRGALIAREAKAWAPSAVEWFDPAVNARDMGALLLDRAIHDADPFLSIEPPWIVRRLAPDCSRIELTELIKPRTEARLLRAMGWETANLHLGSAGTARAIARDLRARRSRWLLNASAIMADATIADWQVWSTGRRAPRSKR